MKLGIKIAYAFIAVILACSVGAGAAVAQPREGEPGYKANEAIQACRDWIKSTYGDGPDPAEADDLGGRITNALREVECNAFGAVSHPLDAAQGIAESTSQYWKDPVGKLAKAVMEGNAEAFQTVMTFWIDFSIDKNVMDSSINGVKNIVLGLAALGLIASLVVGGARIAASRRYGLVDSVESTGSVLGRYLIFSLLVPAMVTSTLSASDILARWILTSFGATSEQEVFGSIELSETTAGPVLMLILTGIAFAGSCMQILSLAIRILLLPIVVGLAPVFAAVSETERGKQGLDHLLSWMIAAILFKPISALLYVVMFWLVGALGHTGDSITSTIMIVLLVGVAGMCGPALVRTVTPVVAQAGGGGAAPMLSGAAAATGATLGAAAGLISGGGAGAAAGASMGRGAAPGGGNETSSTRSGPLGSSPSATTSGGGGGGARAAGNGGAAVKGADSPGGVKSGGLAKGSSDGGAVPSGAKGSGYPRGQGRVGSRKSAAWVARKTPHAIAGSVRTTRSVAGGMLRSGAAVAQTAGHSAGRVQSALDESIGAPGAYHGQIRR